MIKIQEIKGSDWAKGQSAQPNLPIGGLFRSMSNFDPFEQTGVFIPSLNPDNQPLSTVPKFLASFNYIGTDYLLAHTPTKLYQTLKDSPYTVTDVTAQINQGLGTVNKIYGRIKWKGGYVYACNDNNNLGYVRFNSLPVAAANDVSLLSSFLIDQSLDYAPMCIGADGNMYMGNLSRLQVFTSNTGTGGNSTYYFVDVGFYIRDIVSDGKYLVIIADNNAPGMVDRRVGAYKVKVYFWDMVQTDAASRIVPVTIWDIDDSYAVAMKFIDGAVNLITHNGISICNVATQPKQIRPFPYDNVSQDRMVRPLNSSQVAVSNGSMYWVDGVNNFNTDVYAYGNPTSGQQKIFYRPYTTGVTHLATSLLWVGNQLVLGTDEAALNFFNVGSTRGVATFQTLVTEVGLHSYGFTKVVLEQKLAAGQYVSVTAYSNATNSVLSTEIRSYDANNPKQTLLFKRIPIANSPDKFTDITLIVRVAGAKIHRVAVYGTPLDDTNEEL